MGFRDDEDIVGASPSSQERFTRADQGRKEALKRELEARTGNKIRDADVKKLKGLKTQVNLKNLGNQLAGQQDDATKKAAAQAAEARKHETFGTKTHKQEEEQQVQTAQKQEKAEDLMRKEESKEASQQQSQQEYQQQIG